MRNFIIQSIRFLFFVFAQGLIFNSLEIGFGIHIMIYPLFIMLLPFETAIIPMILSAFLLGIGIDSLSNTYGLHASSLVVVAYLRPVVFKAFSPRDGYEGPKEGNIFEMGQRGFLLVFGSLLLFHHFWFFMLEIFNFNEVVNAFKKLILSIPISLFFCVLFQYLFIKRVKN